MTQKKEEDFYFLEPDKDDLVGEWTKQPGYFYEYAVRLADSRKAYAEVKAELDLVEADIDMDIREDPAKYGIAKVTEALISNTIKRQKDYRDKQKALIQAKHTMDELDAAVRALEHKKAAIEGLVTLRMAEYYSEPKIPKDHREATQDRERSTVLGKASASLNQHR